MSSNRSLFLSCALRCFIPFDYGMRDNHIDSVFCTLSYFFFLFLKIKYCEDGGKISHAIFLPLCSDSFEIAGLVSSASVLVWKT